MATHHDDEQQLEDLKRWWSENWLALVAGLVIGFGAIGGWQGWKVYQERQSLAASQMFDDLKKAAEAGKTDEARGIADKLQSDYASTPYASGGALRLAQIAVDARQPDEALSRLGWVAEHGFDPAVRQLAQLRKARVLWSQQKTDEALKLLDGEAGEYKALYAELRGDIALTKGDRDAARSAYQAAYEATSDQAANRILLQQKIDDLAVETSTTAPVKS
jgi:predicted negative regulator of RcsB-dependent stress response